MKRGIVIVKITVINGTSKKGTTYKIKEMLLNELRDYADITEFYLPKDCPSFCTGCLNCVLKNEFSCKDSKYVQIIDESMRKADLLIFTCPTYVYHVTGALKNMLDHFAYRWIIHKPAKDMFGKRAVIITQCLGGGCAKAAKDIKDSLSWWGVSSIMIRKYKLMNSAGFDEISEKRRSKIEKDLKKTAEKIKSIDYSKPSHTNISAKIKFFIVKNIQKNISKTNPQYADYLYWKENGWMDGVKPWKN